MKREEYESAMAALDHIRSSLRKYSIRKPGDPQVSGAPGRLEGDQDAKSEATDQSNGFLELDGVSGEPEMPEGDSPADVSNSNTPEPSPMRMLSYKSKSVAPRGTNPPAPPHLADVSESSKRPRGRPRKVF